ncbi:hypothetical protein HH308_27545 [Gordonia sp. TBRC 11910]|uniref:PDGLE domain-containing protein n=1 Tax=Gordonia asplenii TaxID=2725283 RepID=A0A848L937_9ACTN|nr:PDGLE domain-containing protein [Gordonia asplenii]NMO04981.1 hypothetical protein [Gordonia asplenii]
MTRRRLLAIGMFVTLVIAGAVSYFAVSTPDGLDATTQRGCQTVKVDGVEQLHGSCIAQHVTDHAMASSPLAGYSVAGLHGATGIAGIVGVFTTLAVAGGLLWLLARKNRASA